VQENACFLSTLEVIQICQKSVPKCTLYYPIMFLGESLASLIKCFSFFYFLVRFSDVTLTENLTVKSLLIVANF